MYDGFVRLIVAARTSILFVNAYGCARRKWRLSGVCTHFRFKIHIVRILFDEGFGAREFVITIWQGRKLCQIIFTARGRILQPCLRNPQTWHQVSIVAKCPILADQDSCADCWRGERQVKIQVCCFANTKGAFKLVETHAIFFKKILIPCVRALPGTDELKFIYAIIALKRNSEVELF